MWNQGARDGFKDHLLKVDIPDVPKEERLGPGQANLNTIRRMQVQQLNNLLKTKWKRRRKRSIAPKLEFGARPDNPWRDRYLLCGDCEHRQDYKRLPPKSGCECSTMLELDMTVPYSRENVMVVSCELAQMIREDVWLKEDEEGNLIRVEKTKDGKRPYGAFPARVCASCRKTSIDERRIFKQCLTCEGVSYCSDECMAKHRMIHKASCTLPSLPDRQEWGVRKPLRKFSKEVYPLIKRYAIREPEEHRIAWLPRPPDSIEKRLKAGEEARWPKLPGFGKERLLPMEGTKDAEVQEDGKVALVKSETFALRRPRKQRPIDPDENNLLNLGMTREEFLKKDAQLRAAAEKRDQEALALQLAREAEGEEEETGPKPFEPFVYAERGPVPRMEAPQSRPRLGLRLDDRAVERVEAAARDGADMEPPERPEVAPWEEFEDDEPGLTVNRTEVVTDEDGKPVEEEPEGPVPPAEREGVVRKQSLTEQVAKKRGLRLSPAALKRLEAAAKAGKDNEKNMDWIQPAKGPDF